MAVSEVAVAFRQPALQAAVLEGWGGAAAEPCWKCGKFVGRRVGRAAAVEQQSFCPFILSEIICIILFQ